MKNIEVKTPLKERASIEARLERHGAQQIWVRRQRDTFYAVPRGWLKLREEEDASPVLISYWRSTDSTGPRPSTYDIAPVTDAELWKSLLERVLVVDAVVEKERTLWSLLHTRVHLDRVVGLGDFLELETVMKRITQEEAEAESDWVIAALDLDRTRFIAVPYRTLQEKKAKAGRISG